MQLRFGDSSNSGPVWNMPFNSELFTVCEILNFQKVVCVGIPWVQSLKQPRSYVLWFLIAEVVIGLKPIIVKESCTRAPLFLKMLGPTLFNIIQTLKLWSALFLFTVTLPFLVISLTYIYTHQPLTLIPCFACTSNFWLIQLLLYPATNQIVASSFDKDYVPLGC